MKYVPDIRTVPAEVKVETKEIRKSLNYPAVGTRIHFTDGISDVYGVVTDGGGLDKYPNLAGYIGIQTSFGESAFINATKYDIELLDDEPLAGPDTLDGGSVD